MSVSKSSAVLGGLVLLLSAGCQVAKPQSGSGVLDDTTPPSAEVMAGFDRCVSCHAPFKQPGTNKASWEKLKAKANLIAPRLDPELIDDEDVMPPVDAPAAQQLSLVLRTQMHAAIKPFVTGTSPVFNPTDLPLSSIQMPEGFKISVYAIAKGARSLTMSPNGTLFIGTGGFAHPETKVYAARDMDGDKYAESVVTVLNNMDNPNGVAFKGGALYVAERFKVKKYANIESNLASPPAPTTIWTQSNTQFSNHSWKYIAFGPDGKLYVPVGSPCNICNTDNDPQYVPNLYSRIFRMDDNGANVQEVAKGVRNTVGLAWHPTTGELWFSDNGRDSLGDDLPPDEINRVTATGQNFGFPRCHGNGIADPTYAPQGGCANFNYVKPVVALGAHVAALGLRFYTGDMFPAQYKNQIFVAEHGSWNSTMKVGAKITLAKQNANGTWTSEPFARGWTLESDQVFWGRPVDVLVAPDGALLVSDDKAGVVYRISYEP